MAEEKKTKKKDTKDKKAVKSPKKTDGKKKAEAKVEKTVVPKDYVPRLKKLYQEQIIPSLTKSFGYKNKMLLPCLNKIVLNVGIGTLHQDAKLTESVVDELTIISGQKPVLTKARKSIANFKLRDGMVVGCRVTLRKTMMYEFFDRLISVVIPRVRDFRGLSDKSFDGRGNYSFGVREQIIFPEIDYDKVVKIHGMDITISTTASTDEEAMELMKGFGFPFRRRTEESDKAAA